MHDNVHPLPSREVKEVAVQFFSTVNKLSGVPFASSALILLLIALQLFMLLPLSHPFNSFPTLESGMVSVQVSTLGVNWASIENTVWKKKILIRILRWFFQNITQIQLIRNSVKYVSLFPFESGNSLKEVAY